MTTVIINTEYIKLQDLLKFENLVESGGMAKQLIQEGAVAVNGRSEEHTSELQSLGDVVAFNGGEYTVAYAD